MSDTPVSELFDPSRWTVGEPFAPTLRGEPDDPEARLYARSASDDKAPIVALLAANVMEKDVVAIYSNGGFHGIPGKLIEALERRFGSPVLAHRINDQKTPKMPMKPMTT